MPESVREVDTAPRSEGRRSKRFTLRDKGSVWASRVVRYCYISIILRPKHSPPLP